MKKIISFASDFGTSDGSVGVVKGVINRGKRNNFFHNSYYKEDLNQDNRDA
jgi:S-adenosylmethionine hydrolase